MKRINESMVVRGTITDSKILKYIRECIDNLISIGYEIDNDIYFCYGDSTNTFGEMILPDYEGGMFTLVLNKNMFDEDEDSIKNTIYHELAHYINEKDLLAKGIYWWENDTVKATKSVLRSRKYSAHGTLWQWIADSIYRELHLSKPISRTDTYETHTGVGAVYDSRIKYIVRCKNCGYETKWMKKTEFVKNPNEKSPFGDWYKWQCGNCHKGGMFEVEEIKH